MKGEKKCPVCKKVLPLTHFYYSHKNGFQSYCKDCQKDYRQRHSSKEYKYMKDSTGQIKISFS